MGNVIKYLYSQLILRDFLSFITPGAIVVIAAFLLLWPELCLSQRLDLLFGYSKSIHWLLYIPIFGLFYMVGYAVQCFGELVGFNLFSPYSKGSLCKRWGMFCCNFIDYYINRDKDGNIKDPKKENAWWWEEEEKLSEFYEEVEKSEKEKEQYAGVRQGHERLVALKHMAGNGFMAILIAGVLIVVSLWHCTIAHAAVGALLVIVLIVSLFWGHRIAMLKQYTREEVFMKRRGKR